MDEAVQSRRRSARTRRKGASARPVAGLPRRRSRVATRTSIHAGPRASRTIHRARPQGRGLSQERPHRRVHHHEPRLRLLRGIRPHGVGENFVQGRHVAPVVLPHEPGPVRVADGFAVEGRLRLHGPGFAVSEGGKDQRRQRAGELRLVRLGTWLSGEPDDPPVPARRLRCGRGRQGTTEAETPASNGLMRRRLPRSKKWSLGNHLDFMIDERRRWRGAVVRPAPRPDLLVFRAVSVPATTEVVVVTTRKTQAAA